MLRCEGFCAHRGYADRGVTNLEHTDGIDKINRYDFGEVFFLLFYCSFINTYKLRTIYSEFGDGSLAGVLI